jgi:hypothetical protein
MLRRNPRGRALSEPVPGHTPKAQASKPLDNPSLLFALLVFMSPPPGRRLPKTCADSSGNPATQRIAHSIIASC